MSGRRFSDMDMDTDRNITRRRTATSTSPPVISRRRGHREERGDGGRGVHSDGDDADCLPDPAPVSSAELARRVGSKAPSAGELAATRRRELVGDLGFDPDVVKHAWHKAGLAVPGTYNPLLVGLSPHGAQCPLCRYVASASEDDKALNHVNLINDIIRMSSLNSDNIEGTAHMISSYWEVNVMEPRREDGLPCEELSIAEAREHLQTVVVDGLSDARQTLRNIRALENAAVAHLMLRNDVTGETKLNADAAQVLQKIPMLKKLLHETQWSKSQFGLPARITPEVVATVGPLLKIYS